MSGDEPVDDLADDLDADLAEAAAAPGEPTPGLRRARAWLSRAVEPGTVDAWRFVDRVGPVEAVRLIRSGRAPARILGLVGVLVMLSMRRDPEDRSALERQRGTDRQEILKPPRRAEAAVRMQPVIAHADAEPDRHPVQECGHE